jgi:hypothetical protein
MYLFGPGVPFLNLCFQGPEIEMDVNLRIDAISDWEPSKSPGIFELLELIRSHVMAA